MKQLSSSEKLPLVEQSFEQGDGWIDLWLRCELWFFELLQCTEVIRFDSVPSA